MIDLGNAQFHRILANPRNALTLPHVQARECWQIVEGERLTAWRAIVSRIRTEANRK